jgi:hypothetical protein
MGIFVRQRGDVGGIGGIPVDSIFRQNHVSLNKKTVTLYYPAGEASKHGACKAGFSQQALKREKKQVRIKTWHQKDWLIDGQTWSN